MMWRHAMLFFAALLGLVTVVTADIPSDCAVWYDGCNYCRAINGTLKSCTLRSCWVRGQSGCIQNNTAYPHPPGIIDSCTRYYDGCKTHDAKDGQITSDNNNNDDNDDNDDSCTPSQDVGYCTRHQFPAQNCSIWWDGCKWCQRLERRPQLVTCVRTACTSAADAMEPKCYRAHGNGSGGKACALYFDDCNMCRQCEDEQQVCTTRNCGSSSGGYSYSSSRSRGLSTANMCILGGVLVAVCLLCIFIMHYRISVGRMQARKRWQRELVADPQRSRERSSGGEPATLGLPLEYSPYMGVQPPSTPQSQMSNPQAGRTSGWSDAGAPAPPPTGRCVPADGVPCGQAGGQHEDSRRTSLGSSDEMASHVSMSSLVDVHSQAFVSTGQDPPPMDSIISTRHSSITRGDIYRPSD